VDEEPQLPRRYINIRRKGRKEWKTVRAQVWDQIPGREGEAWLKEVRPVVELAGGDSNVFKLIGKVHAALSDIGLRRRAQKFVTRAYYAGSYEEALRIAEEFVEFTKRE
jgi:hypothetical protein